MSTASKTAPIHGLSGFVMRALSSSLGAKVIMAATGLLFYGWLITHLLGNLGVFAGHVTENSYANFLKANAEILWAQRIFSIVIFPIHLLSGIRLAVLNRAARPTPYASPRTWRQASLASRTMFVSGLIVLGFFLFHIAHFTLGLIPGTFWAGNNVDPLSQQPDVYGMVMSAFHTPWIVAIYLIGVTLVGFHLSHGLWSGIQSLGLNGRKWTPFAQKLGLVMAIAIALGFALIPLTIASGALKDDRSSNTTAALNGAPSLNQRP